MFTGRTDVEAETPILWQPDAKNWLIWKDPDAEKDWRQEEKGMTEDEIVGVITDFMDISLSKLQELVMDKTGMLQSMVLQSWTRLSDCTELRGHSFPKLTPKVLSTHLLITE